MTVQQVPLGEVLHRIARAVKVDASSTYQNVGLLNRSRGMFEKPELRGAETKYKTLYRLAAGDLVYSKLFGWEGAVALVPDWADGACVSGEFPTYSLSSRLDRDYLGHVIAWEGFASQMAVSTTGMGQRRQRVNPDQFERIVIPVPELSEQQRIAARLDRIADASLTPSRSGAAMEPRVSALRAAMFARVSGKAALGDMLERAERPEPVLPDKIYRMLGVRWYARGLFVRDTIAGNALRAKKVFRVEAGDFVYNRLFAWKGSFALAGREHAGCYVSNEFPTFRSNSDKIDRRWLEGAIRLPSLAEAAGELSTGSTPTSRNRLQVQDLLSIEIPLPRLSNQTRLGQQLDRMVSLERAAERRQQLAHALLPAARNEAFASLT